MAIIRSLAVGKAKKSAGNLTYQTVKGRTIAREKPTFVANPNTPRQQAQRRNMRNVVAAWRAGLSILKPFFTAIQGFGSAYNEFVRRNIVLGPIIVWDDELEQIVVRDGAVFSTGKYGPNAIAHDRTGANLDVSVVDYQLQQDLAEGDRIMVPAVDNVTGKVYLGEHDLTSSEITTLKEGGSIELTLPVSSDEVAYSVIYYSSARGTSSASVAVVGAI